MQLIADILLAAGALGAAFYCVILSKRLTKFNNLEKGIGGAVAVLSTQVEELKASLDTAQSTAVQSAEALTELNARAENTSKKLELQLAALHDLPEEKHETVEEVVVPNSTKESFSEPMFVRHAAGGGK